MLLKNDTTYLTLRLSREIAVRNKLQVALITRNVIGDVHFSTLIHPQFAHNDVMNGGRHLPPGIMIS